MTADELITQLVKYSQRIDRLSVPAYAWHMEAAHGVVTGGDSTVFPCSLARAAAWNWAPEFGGRIGSPPLEKHELALSIETGCTDTVHFPTRAEHPVLTRPIPYL